MNYIVQLIDFLFNERIRLSSKTIIVIASLFTLFLLDNILGFSYYFNTSRKIEQLQKLNTIVNDTTLDKNTKEFVLNLRQNIINRENIITQSFFFFRNIKLTSSTKAHINKSIEVKEKAEIVLRNNFWFHISAGGLYYLMGILMLPIMIFADKKPSIIQRIVTGIITGLVFYALGLLFYWICDFIPQLGNSTWIWNYLLNFLIQSILIIIIIVASQVKK
jgi:hypothetical protein